MECVGSYSSGRARMGTIHRTTTFDKRQKHNSLLDRADFWAESKPNW